MKTKLLLTTLASLTIAISAQADEMFRVLPDAWFSDNYENIHALVHTKHGTNQYRRWRDAMIARNQLTPLTANSVVHAFHSTEGIAFVRGHTIDGEQVTLYVPVEDLGLDLGSDDPTPAATPVPAATPTKTYPVNAQVAELLVQDFTSDWSELQQAIDNPKAVAEWNKSMEILHKLADVDAALYVKAHPGKQDPSHVLDVGIAHAFKHGLLGEAASSYQVYFAAAMKGLTATDE
jgi:hypothetical protein